MQVNHEWPPIEARVQNSAEFRAIELRSLVARGDVKSAVNNFSVIYEFTLATREPRFMLGRLHEFTRRFCFSLYRK